MPEALAQANNGRGVPAELKRHLLLNHPVKRRPNGVSQRYSLHYRLDSKRCVTFGIVVLHKE